MTKILNFALKIKGGGREGGTCDVLRPCHPPPPKKFETCTNIEPKIRPRIVEDSGELTKACLKYAVGKVFQNDGHQSYWAETYHQG